MSGSLSIPPCMRMAYASVRPTPDLGRTTTASRPTSPGVHRWPCGPTKGIVRVSMGPWRWRYGGGPPSSPASSWGDPRCTCPCGPTASAPTVSRNLGHRRRSSRGGAGRCRVCRDERDQPDQCLVYGSIRRPWQPRRVLLVMTAYLVVAAGLSAGHHRDGGPRAIAGRHHLSPMVH